MSVESVSYTGTLTNTSSASSDNSSGLSVDTSTFLKLLVAQLQYQNPLDPKSDTDFVSQLAQMTSLEQVQNINSTLESSQAYNMIGKTIYAEVLDSKSGVTNCYLGTVDSVVIQNGEAYAVVDNSLISISDIKRVFNTSDAEDDSDQPATETE